MGDESHQAVAARLRLHKQRIVARWEQRAREHLITARDAAQPALVDSMPDLLDRFAEVLASPHADVEMANEMATQHGQQRAELTSISLDQVVGEYQLLRQVMLEILDEEHPVELAARDLIGELIMGAVRAATTEFCRRRGEGAVAELHEVDTRLRHMVEAVKDYAIFTVDAGGYITSWNDGCVRMKLWTAEEAIGQHFAML